MESNPDDYVTTLSSKDFPNSNPFTSIDIPFEAVLKFADEGAASFLLYNATHLFPSGLPGMENELMLAQLAQLSVTIECVCYVYVLT